MEPVTMSTAARIGIVAAMLAASAETVAQRRESRADPSVYRSGVELVTLHVTVTDQSRHYLTELDEQEFRVFENGRRQDLKFFQRSGLPLALTLLIDTSSSVQQALPSLRRAAVRFIRELDPLDVASVVTFGDTVRVLQDFTTDRSAVERAINTTRARGATALYNGVYIALTALAKTVPNAATNVPHRRTLLVMSDGDDSSSGIGFEDVLDLAARMDVAVYTIRLGKPRPILLRGDGDFVLRRLAAQTGARAFFPPHDHELRRALTDIRTELSSQYALAYESDDRRDDGRFRTLAVLVGRAGAVARTRPGYVGRRE
jgi:Ca-activated chloride channel homolog